MEEELQSIEIANLVADISDDFELCNTELKKEYLKLNLQAINRVLQSIDGCCGTFGTGYPFYALKENLCGDLPVIYEQMRYNDELRRYSEASTHPIWSCYYCLNSVGDSMPDLKQWCKPCPKMDDELKPRKLLNRLPDVDMFLIIEDDKFEAAQKQVIDRFTKVDLHTSDVDPVRTIVDLKEIVDDLKSGKMPSKLLPLDVHLVKKSQLSMILDLTHQAVLFNNPKPFVPIHPLSLRKKWQYDDTAYNFMFDFLYSLTPFNWDEDLMQKLLATRKELSKKSDKELEDMLLCVSSDSVKRRQETHELQLRYKERTNSWKE